MLLELMSNGTLAELPPESMPAGLSGDSSIVLLLPHNKYLLGQHGNEWALHDSPSNSQNIFLYDNQPISLINDDAEPTFLPAEIVNMLRKELLAMSEPPGNHTGAVLMLRTFMHSYPIFMSEGAEYLDEKIFLRAIKDNPMLLKAYWALRFAMNRSELETLTRLKAWLKTGPEIFTKPGHDMKIWFSLLEIPDDETVSELEALSFSRLEITRMVAQKASPIVVYNQVSGWLVLGRFGRRRDTMFFLWAYFSHDLWNELRERKKLPVNDIILASWGEYETRQAMIERAKYKGDEDITE